MRLLSKAIVGLLLFQAAVVGLVMAVARALPGDNIIAFSAPGPASQDIFIQDLNTGIARNLTASLGGHHENQPAWSPDGLEIAFASAPDAYAPNHIYIIGMDGSSLRQITDSAGSEFSPAWSPDGGQVAFVSYRAGSMDIYVVDADGNNAQKLTENPLLDDAPTWSPGGRQIAFHSTRYDADFNVIDTIYVVDVDGKNEQRLIEGPYAHPVWSPDGTQLAVLSSDGKIYVMNIHDGSLHPLETAGVQMALTWLPAGRRMAYMSAECSRCAAEVYVIDVNTGVEHLFTFGSRGGSLPVWRPGT